MHFTTKLIYLCNMEELLEYFRKVEIPAGIYTNGRTPITDVQLFIHAHLSVLESNFSDEVKEQYIKRLENLKKQIEHGNKQ